MGEGLGVSDANVEDERLKVYFDYSKNFKKW